jgi:hypothetical protein
MSTSQFLVTFAGGYESMDLIKFEKRNSLHIEPSWHDFPRETQPVPMKYREPKGTHDF